MRFRLKIKELNLTFKNSVFFLNVRTHILGLDQLREIIITLESNWSRIGQVAMLIKGKYIFKIKGFAIKTLVYVCEAGTYL